jgi:hypothetical protein
MDESPKTEVVKAYTVPRAFTSPEIAAAIDSEGGHVVKAQRMNGPRAISFDNDKQRNAQNINKGLAKPGYISYDTLRRASRSVHIVRICITVLKEKVSKTKWVVRPKDPLADKAPFKEQIDQVSALLKKPNRNGDTWRSFIDKSLEDLYVCDAISWEKTRYPDGVLAELYQVDSTTIHPVFNEWGQQDVEIPLPTEGGETVLPVSYLQVLNYSQYGGPQSGDVIAAWPKKDMQYFHMHPQGSLEGFGFGLSPIESVLSIVANLLNADNYNGTYFEEGAFPPVILQLIGQVNERDLETYREYLMSELMGQFHRPAIMAGAQKAEVLNLKNLTNNDMQFMEYQNWLAKLMTAAYGLTAQDINLGERSGMGGGKEAETDQELSEGKGYSSTLELIKEQVNLIIENDFGFDGIEFDWVADDTLDETELTDITDKRLKNGSITLNEVRDKFGEKRFGTWADQPVILTSEGQFNIVGPQSFVDPQEVREQQNELEEKKIQGPDDKEGEEEEGGDKKPTEKSIRKAVFTPNYKTWMDDYGYSQPFIYQDILTGQGWVVKPPVAVNLMSQELEVELSQRIAAKGVNVPPVEKKTFKQVIDAMPPEVLVQFQQYINLGIGYDSEKWKGKIGASRKFPYYLVQPFLDGYKLTSPLLLADMKRDPDSYKQAIKDLAELWKVEKDMVLGDRRIDQYIITRDKRGWGYDFQFSGDKERWANSEHALSDFLKQIPELYDVFKVETGLLKSITSLFKRSAKSSK